MAWSYYFLDNGGKEQMLSNGKKWRRTARLMHYCCTLQEAVIQSKPLLCGQPIEIHYRYGSHPPVAVIEPDGSIHDSHGNPVCLYDTKGNRL